MIPQRPGRQSQSGRYTSRVIKKLAEDDTKVVLNKAHDMKNTGRTATGSKATEIVLDPDAKIQGQSQFS